MLFKGIKSVYNANSDMENNTDDKIKNRTLNNNKKVQYTVNYYCKIILYIVLQLPLRKNSLLQNNQDKHYNITVLILSDHFHMQLINEM